MSQSNDKRESVCGVCVLEKLLKKVSAEKLTSELRSRDNNELSLVKILAAENYRSVE